MGSPLKLVLVGISIFNLERSLVCLLAAEPRFWKRYVDDTITFVKTGTVDHILSMLNNFHLISNSHMRQNKKKTIFLRCYAMQRWKRYCHNSLSKSIQR